MSSFADKSKKTRTRYTCSDPESHPESEANSVSGTFISFNTMVCWMSVLILLNSWEYSLFVFFTCVRGGEDSSSDGAQT